MSARKHHILKTFRKLVQLDIMILTILETDAEQFEEREKEYPTRRGRLGSDCRIPATNTWPEMIWRKCNKTMSVERKK